MLALENFLRCDLCGAPLKSSVLSLGCLNCLLLGRPDDKDAGRRFFQHYEICLRADATTLDELGRGAMGVTYRARDVNLDSPVALKVISARYSRDPETRARFQSEARAAAQLRHPNVASVFHFGETPEGQLFYAMELVEGETLEARVRQDGPVPAALALEIGIQVARALIAAESLGLIHRDLKPSNLMLVANDRGAPDLLSVKVIDFGLARVAAAGSTASAQEHLGFSGTPDFASPEQFRGSGAILDTRSDIYSLGATLWYSLSGQVPFIGRASGSPLDPSLPLTPLPPTVPVPVAALLRSMLATEPAARPLSARELLNALRRSRQMVAARPRRRRRRRLVALTLGLSIFATLGLTNYFWHRRPPTLGLEAAPEKSIAILPFANLTGDKESGAFAEGVQDEILTSLAKIEGLKVISRTSVMRYQPGAVRNLREIGQQLGVAHLLEGSVQRAGGRVRVIGQLIDARSDSHIWGQTYDRDLQDVFAIQSEIAHAIAEQLRANISPKVKSAIEERPTKSLESYDLYVAAKLLTKIPEMDAGNLYRAVLLLDRAIARDSEFFLAYCLSAQTHSLLYSVFDHTPARRELAGRALKASLQLRPEAGEAHLAQATYLYRCDLDYEKARTELGLATLALPNEAQVFELMSSVDVFQGHWNDAVRAHQKALELDPRNGSSLFQAALTYRLMRRFADAVAALDRAVALDPQDTGLRVVRAQLDLDWRADSKPLH